LLHPPDDPLIPWNGMRLRLRSDYDCTKGGTIAADGVAGVVCTAMKK
jgi:hypothetical protein